MIDTMHTMPIETMTIDAHDDDRYDAYDTMTIDTMTIDDDRDDALRTMIDR
jgi:hypothetical protein